MKGRSGPCGFSLIEVVIALGVFAFAVLALLGLMARLLGGTEGSRDSGRIGQVVTLGESWLHTEEARGFDSLAERLRSGLPLYVYAWQAEGAALRWRVVEQANWRPDHARFQAGAGVFRSPIHRVWLHHDPALQPVGISPADCLALRAEVSVRAAGDPARSTADVEQSLNGAGVHLTFFTTVRR